MIIIQYKMIQKQHYKAAHCVHSSPAWHIIVIFLFHTIPIKGDVVGIFEIVITVTVLRLGMDREAHDFSADQLWLLHLFIGYLRL